jgi:hypothetical protein
MAEGGWSKLFAWRQPAIPAEVVERIRDWTRAAWATPDDAVIKVNEIICADPACPGNETVVLVMAPGYRTVACKVQADAAEVTREQIIAAIAAQGPLTKAI